VATIIVDSVSLHPKGGEASIRLPDITSQETVIFIITDVACVLEVKAACSSETSANICQIAQHHIP
jgi:hypothetical protein